MKIKKALTVKGVESAEIRATRYELGDALCPGFYLSVMPSGHKSYCARYRFNGVSKRLGIGSHPQIALEAARKAAREALGKVALGEDPAGQKAASRKPSASSGDVPKTVDQLVEKFLAKHVRRTCRASTIASYERILTKEVLPVWKGRAIDTIKRADVRALLDDIVDDRPILANRVLAVISSMFTWAIEQEIVEASPTTKLKKPAEENERERALTDAELRILLSVTSKLSRTGRDFINLLLLTAQRRCEVSNAKWDEFDLETRTWTIPKERTKNKRQHRVPISEAATAILRERKKDDTGPYVFIRDKNPYSNFGRLKIELDELIENENGGPFTESWRFHDLRRTGASIMPRLGVSLPVVERVLNHVSGSFGGIVGTYQTYQYEPEMRTALEKWAEHLAKIQDDNVIVELRRRA